MTRLAGAGGRGRDAPGADAARERDAALLAAGLRLGRVLAGDEDDVRRRIGPWLLATVAERVTLPAPAVVADVGGLLFGAALRGDRAPGTDDPALATALRRYEDALLGRLAAEPRLVAAGDAVARLPPELHPQAVGILVAALLGRLEASAPFAIEPGLVRRLTADDAGGTLDRGLVALRDDADVRHRLAGAYAALARGAQRARALLGDEELFALENLAVLRSLGQRQAIADVLRAEAAISAGLPPRLPRRRRPAGDVASHLDDESTYPMGGFASVSTAGSLENLVTSELIYMDPPSAAVRPPVDLFDLRYVEGELLYYVRDEAILVRRRREIVFALDADLARARVKDVGLPFQRIVLVLGAVLAAVKRLVVALGDEALLLRVVFVADDEGRPALGEERALAELLFRPWIEPGLVAVTAATWPALVAGALSAARRAEVGIVWVHDLPRPAPALDPRIVRAELEAPRDALTTWSARVAAALAALL